MQLGVSGVLLGAVGLVMAIPLASDGRLVEPSPVIVVWASLVSGLIVWGVALVWRTARPGGDDLTRDVDLAAVEVVQGRLTKGVLHDLDGGDDHHWIAVGSERFAVGNEVWDRLVPGATTWSAWVLPRTRALVALETTDPLVSMDTASPQAGGSALHTASAS
jgi:hypothetical protein